MRAPLATIASLAALSLALGCSSTSSPAYQKAYEEETRRLETQQEAQEQAEVQRKQAAFDEANRYAAVVYFEIGSSVISEDGHRQLVWFVENTKGAPEGTKWAVQGFADATGGDAINQQLSRERADNVADALVALGIPELAITVQGFAAEFAADDNSTAAGRKNNRRVEVTLR